MSQLKQNTTDLDLLILKASNLPSVGESTKPVLQAKTITPTTSPQEVVPDNGYDGLSRVTVQAVSTETWVFTMSSGECIEKDVGVM